MAVRRTKKIRITRVDPVAEEVVRLARDLMAGRRDVGRVAEVDNVKLMVAYLAGWGGEPGEWYATVPIAPAGQRYVLADANGHTADEAVRNLLGVLHNIPLVAWD